jgi:hypothetical protein
LSQVRVWRWEAQFTAQSETYATTLAPWAMVPSHGRSQGAQAPTRHAALVYVPESTPFMHVRVWETAPQEPPQGTEAAAYAVVVLPLAIDPPQGRVHGQDSAAHDAFMNEPDNVPLVQVRVWETVPQEPPHATEVAEYAVVLLPLAIDPPHGSAQEAHAPTVHAALVYVPESTPPEHVRTCDAQELPHVTDAA